MELIGTITKPQGIKGEFRVNPEISVPFKTIKKVQFNNSEYEVEKVNDRQGFVIFKVKGIEDRNTVETLRNVKIYAEISRKLEKGEVLINDVLGFEVITEQDERLGVLESIEDYGTAQVYEVTTSEGSFMFPNARSVIKNFDMINKKIVVDSKILSETRIDN